MSKDIVSLAETNGEKIIFDKTLSETYYLHKNVLPNILFQSFSIRSYLCFYKMEKPVVILTKIFQIIFIVIYYACFLKILSWF